MILSNIEIHNAIDQGLLVIRPDPQPRTPTASNPNDCPYNTTSVDLRLGDTLSVPRAGPFTFDLRIPGLATFLSQNYDDVKMQSTGGFALQPNVFILGRTLEKIELPINLWNFAYAGRYSLKVELTRVWKGNPRNLFKY